MIKKIRYFLIIALIALVIIQFISIDKSNPPVDPAQDFIEVTGTPYKVAQIFKSACYDCHSHESAYPWYTNVQPVAWWVKGHIKVGRQKLNFSEWSTYDDKKAIHKIEEMVEEIGDRHMPLKSYVWMHSEAKLSDEDIGTMTDWLKSL